MKFIVVYQIGWDQWPASRLSPSRTVEIEAAGFSEAMNIARRHSQIEGRVVGVMRRPPDSRQIMTRMVPSNSLPQCHREAA
jgi:hypothetical protein